MNTERDSNLWLGITIGVIGTIVIGILLILMGFLAFEV